MRLPAPTILSLLILATPSGLAAMDPGLRTTRPALAPFNLVRERSYQLRQGSTFPLPDTLVAIATVTLDGVEVPFERVLSTSHPLEYRVTIPEATPLGSMDLVITWADGNTLTYPGLRIVAKE